MWWSRKKISLNKSIFKVTSPGVDPYNTVNVIPEWLSKQLKEFITIPLAIASTIFTYSQYLIISNILVVFIHLMSYLYGLYRQRENVDAKEVKNKNHKIFITIIIAIVSILIFYAALIYSIPTVVITSPFLHFLFELNIWASAASLYLSCRNFILSLWYCVVRDILVPIANCFKSDKNDSKDAKSLKWLYKNIFFFRKQITDEEAVSMGYRYILDQFTLNLDSQNRIQSPCQKDQQTLVTAARRFNRVLKFLIKRVNIKHYALFGFLANQREIENLKTLIDKLLRKGDIIDIILFVQNRINYKLTQITQIDELLDALPFLTKKSDEQPAVSHLVVNSLAPPLSHAQMLGDVLSSNSGPRVDSAFTHFSSAPHTTDCLLATSSNSVRRRPPMRLDLIRSSHSFSGTRSLLPQPSVTSEDFIRYKSTILRAFNLKKGDFEKNTDNCQEEIRNQLEKQKALFNKEVEKLTALMPNHVRKKRVGSPAH